MFYTPAIKLTLHEQYLNFIEGKGKPYVLNAEISPSGRCKARCDWCFYRGNLSSQLIDGSKLDAAIKNLKQIGCKAITWSGGGEPTTHPDLASLVENNQEMSHGLFTNALYPFNIKPECLKWVRITWTPKLKRENIEQFTAIKKVGMVVNYSGSEDIIEQALSLAEETGLKYLHVRPALGIKGDTVNIKPPTIKHPLLKYQEYKFNEAGEKHQYKKCYGYHFVPFIAENGNVYVCNYMTEDDYKIGSIYDNTMQEILEKAQRFFPVKGGCQVCCKNHEINTLLNFAIDIDEKEFV